MGEREPCEHVWGPWETVYEGTWSDGWRITGDRVRCCALCQRWEAEWAAPRWSDLFGIDPNYTGGVPVDEWLEENRGDA